MNLRPILKRAKLHYSFLAGHAVLTPPIYLSSVSPPLLVLFAHDRLVLRNPNIHSGSDQCNRRHHSSEPLRTPGPQVEAESEDEAEEQEPDPPEPRYPRRNRQAPENLTYPAGNLQVETPLELRHNLHGVTTQDPDLDGEYSPIEAPVMASLMVDMHHRSEDVIRNTCLGQQYILQKGLKVFKEKGVQAAKKEADQLHGREAFAPIDVATLTDIEREHACDAIMFLSEKRDKTVKGRMVFNGKPSREWHDKVVLLISS